MTLRLKNRGVMRFGIVLVAGCSLATLFVPERGMWPDTWPKELDPYRERARTAERGDAAWETVHDIPFENRDDFERLWPVILSLKGERAPLIFERSPSSYLHILAPMDAGVRVLYPDYPDWENVAPDGKPWPESIRLESGQLPEYAIKLRNDNRWISFDRSKHKYELGMYSVRHRVRVDMVLVVDGEIVDLNRITLPPDTPVIDRRFQE